MEVITCLNNAIDYIETNIASTLAVDEIAKVAFSSRYHFQRMFHALTGFTLAEYIRNRRLTLAAQELYTKHARIIDVALKYGYESPDAFSKAFQRLHGATPSALKKGNVRLKAFPKLSFQISIKGECEMIYRIVEKEKYEMFGTDFLTTTVDDACYREIPEFCDKIWEDGTHYKINQFLGYPRMHMLQGIHYDFQEDGSRNYMMGWEVQDKEIPKEFKVLKVPAATWAVFEGKGEMPQNLAIQEIWKRIYAEWFPSSGFEQEVGPCIEYYSWEDDKMEHYTCEVWIPVKKKE